MEKKNSRHFIQLYIKTEMWRRREALCSGT
jgi:hypothetical protein